VNIVLDTNVLVSGLLNPHGIPGRIVDMVTSGNVVVLFDDRILAEYREVLARPRLGISPQNAADILDLIETDGLLTPAVPVDVELPDADGLPFIEEAEAGRSMLVTGNGRHFLPSRGIITIPVSTPAEFFDSWQRSRRHPASD
jgi:putative PIN family toxin of toxin-antitoxin system